MTDIQISVIIPVYNAAPYIREAVESAVSQPEVVEVILAEDGSPDNSLEVCRQLAEEHACVSVYTHEHNANKGPAATRNLAIEHSTSDYIAFLDADDYFMPDRFAETVRIFDTDATVDGVYEGMGQFYVENEQNIIEQTHTPTNIPSEQLFEAIARRTTDISTISLCIKRDLLDRTGPFDETLNKPGNAEDFVMKLKLVYFGRLVPGSTAPVSVARIHRNNRFTGKTTGNNLFFRQSRRLIGWKTIWKWGRPLLSNSQKNALLAGFDKSLNNSSPFPGLNYKIRAFVYTRVHLLSLLLFDPSLCTYIFYWRQFLPKPSSLAYRRRQLLGMLSHRAGAGGK